jgi:AraC-like DNA-binding protein
MEIIKENNPDIVINSAAYTDVDGQRYDQSSLVTMGKNVVYQLRNGKKEAILLKYDLKTNDWAELLRTPYHLNNMELNDSLLYVPCEYGYWVVNTNTGETSHFDSMLLETGQTMATDVNVMAFDRQGGLWLGTENRGILYSRPFKPPFKVYPWGNPIADRYGAMMNNVDEHPTFRDRTVNCVYKDSRGWTWVGTPQGLQVYRKESDMLPQVYTIKDGLFNNIVHSIVEDDRHNIWVGTSYGISAVLFNADGRVYRINSYNEYDHVPDEVFVNGKAMKLPDGTIVMQGLDHVVEFNPAQFTTLYKNYKFKIYPKLIQLMVNGIDVNTNTVINGRKMLDRALSRLWGVDLDYSENSITMVFSALNYFRPQQTFYRVRVVGLDDEWRILTPYDSNGMIDSNGLLHLPLISLRPGHYEVEVQASMLPDEWDTKPYVWTIDINEPWWRTTGMFALFGLLVTVLIFANVFYYMKNANLRAQRNSEEVMLVKRIYNFVERIEGREEIIEPTADEYTTAETSVMNDLDPAFVKAIGKVKMIVTTEKMKKVNMRRLSNAAGLDPKRFYQLVMDNIFKSPRTLIKEARVEEAEKMLRNTKASIEEISKECGFVSANYFIASFFQKYKVTPQAYRDKR